MTGETLELHEHRTSTCGIAWRWRHCANSRRAAGRARLHGRHVGRRLALERGMAPGCCFAESGGACERREREERLPRDIHGELRGRQHRFRPARWPEDHEAEDAEETSPDTARGSVATQAWDNDIAVDCTQPDKHRDGQYLDEKHAPVWAGPQPGHCPQL